MLKELIRKYRKYRKARHKHTMVIQQYSEETCEGKKTYSREICRKCGWVDYDSFWTRHNKPDNLL